MQPTIRKVEETAAFLKKNTALVPSIGMLTGTGLGQSAASLDLDAVYEYRQLPNFPLSTVASHPGRLLLGRMHGHAMMVMQGRFHLYEGYSPLEVIFPIRVMQAMGVTVLIVTNAAGGLNPNFIPGDIMLISDHINLTGANPLIGPNADQWGLRFPDMTRAYDPRLAELCRQAAAANGIKLQVGVYAGLSGPSLETPAEVRMLKTIGVDAVGFSTVHEVIAAVHAGMKILALSTITNVNDPDQPVPATLEEIITVAQTAAPTIDRSIADLVEKMDAPETS